LIQKTTSAVYSRRRILSLFGAAVVGGFAPGRELLAMGPNDRVSMSILRYDSPGWNPRPAALTRLLLEVQKRTSIEVSSDISVVSASGGELYRNPFLVIGGDRGFKPWPDTWIEELRQFVKIGGFVFVDSAEGVMDGPFLTSIRREMRRVFPQRQSAPIAYDQVIYKSFYLVDRALGRIAVSDKLEGIWEDDRLCVVLSQNDMLGAWSRNPFGQWDYDCTPGGDRQREQSYRLGINLVMYALCVNYKSDQVHVPFILNRRNWRID
jgi:hypothetical protein